MAEVGSWWKCAEQQGVAMVMVMSVVMGDARVMQMAIGMAMRDARVAIGMAMGEARKARRKNAEKAVVAVVSMVSMGVAMDKRAMARWMAMADAKRRLKKNHWEGVVAVPTGRQRC